MKNIKKQSGFTVIELLIATAVFSVVLLVFITAFLRISELFYKGVNLSNTQEAARTITQDIASDIQFYHAQPQSFANYFCIGSHRYAFNQFVQYVPGTNYGLLEEDLSGCPALNSPSPNTNTGHELLSAGMQLNKMQISCALNECTVSVRVVFYGSDPSVLSPAANSPTAVCTGPDESTQFCATAEYNSTVVLQGT